MRAPAQYLAVPPFWDKLGQNGREQHAMEKIGMVGIGAMGSALLERLRLADMEIVAFDVAAPALAAAEALGARLGSSAAAVAQESTLVDVVVRTDQDVLDCALGPNGLIEGANPETLIILHSTIRPETTQRVAAEARQRNVHVIDACMLGVPRVVRQGSLTFVAGGPAELFQRAKPHLLKMGKEAFHMGPLGAGNVAKLIKNLVTASDGLVIYEALRIARAGGIPYREALEMMHKTQSEPILNRWQERFDISGGELIFRVGANLYDKDVPLAAAVGNSLGVDSPVTDELARLGLRLLGNRR